MLCQDPWIKVPAGIGDKVAKTNYEARDAMTPFACGKCIPCLKFRQRVWAHRIMLESSSHPYSSFVTLTYNDENLPVNGNLKPYDLTCFLKRLRWRLGGRRIRYFACGEYGKLNRPHYHAVIFNLNWMEEKLVAESWDKGFIQISELNEKRAYYISKYVVKGLGKGSKSLEGRTEEFMRCSKTEGGLGKKFVEGAAEKIKKSGFENHIGHINSVNYGRVKKPLGRYLTNILCSYLPQSQRAKSNEFNDYQMELVNKHGGAVVYKDSILDEFKGQRERLINKHLFFQKGGTI